MRSVWCDSGDGEMEYREPSAMVPRYRVRRKTAPWLVFRVFCHERLASCRALDMAAVAV